MSIYRLIVIFYRDFWHPGLSCEEYQKNRYLSLSLSLSFSLSFINSLSLSLSHRKEVENPEILALQRYLEVISLSLSLLSLSPYLPISLPISLSLSLSSDDNLLIGA